MEHRIHWGACFLALSCLAFSSAGGRDESAIERGGYVFRASGGCSCHTDNANRGEFLAGGRSINTPFGTIYGTNITPDPETASEGGVMRTSSRR